MEAGVDFGMLGSAELCCGSTITRVGDVKNFGKVKAKCLELLNGLGIRTIVTACAGCHSTLSHSYKGDLVPEVVHMTEFMARLAQQGRLPFKREVEKTVTYHDPCHIGRYSRIFDAPRAVLGAIPGVKFREMERIREWSLCCGAGGGCKTAYPDYAQWAAMKRIDEATDTGAEIIVSACPFCENNLGDAALAGNYALEVMDLMALVNMAL
jgi:heterodisulfide reductase subunit D